ncbi:head-tail connector protein [Rhizobium sp. PP-F2F-G48]|uniref:head-tail connector protein n=1 Tax=Rhizobium sp. PP-F2F-G48 TaxID=2135651 RepID=UPI00104CE730|nr:head-tail connector protein [Rhizobium sp. PP-F2F-G48]
MSLFVLSGPEPLVTLEEAKVFLRVDESGDFDALITSLLIAAQTEFDGPNGWVGRCFGRQSIQYEHLHWYFPACFKLPFAEVLDLTSIETRTSAGWSLVDRAVYECDGDVVRLSGGQKWPEASAARITISAGMESGDPRLEQVRAAILFHCKMHFDDGDFGDRLRRVIDALLNPLRVF